MHSDVTISPGDSPRRYLARTGNHRTRKVILTKSRAPGQAYFASRRPAHQTLATLTGTDKTLRSGRSGHGTALRQELTLSRRCPTRRSPTPRHAGRRASGSLRARHRVARRAGHGVAVLLKIYAHRIDGQTDVANQRITDALSTPESEPGPGDEGADSGPAA
jgi:hypothetical protein